MLIDVDRNEPEKDDEELLGVGEDVANFTFLKGGVLAYRIDRT